MSGVTTAHKWLQLGNGVLGTYNLLDCTFTAQLVAPLLREITDHGQRDYYEQWIEPLQTAVIHMQKRGIRLDRESKTQYRRELRKELRGVDEAIRKCADQASFTYTDKFPNSDIQVATLLFENLGLKPAGRTEKAKRPSVNQESLIRVLRDLRKRDEPHRQVLYDLLHRSRLQTIDERYLDIVPAPDGRIRAQVKMCGAKSLRFAYAQPALQQFPNECRKFLVAEPGKVFLVPDFKQIEARIMAIESNDTVSLTAFQMGEDIHVQNSYDLFGYSHSSWLDLSDSARKACRSYSKSHLYRIGYGGEGSDKEKHFCPCPRCADKNPPLLQLKRNEKRAAEERWFRQHPAVRRWHTELEKGLFWNRPNTARTGKDQFGPYYQTPFGWRRYVSAPPSRELGRELRNIPEQTTAAELMNRAQVRLDRREAPIVLQWHDSFWLEIPEGKIDFWANVCREEMEQPVAEIGDTVFPVDIVVGYNGQDYDKATNPLGLRPYEG